MEQVPKQIGTQLMCAPYGAVVEGWLEEDVAGGKCSEELVRNQVIP